MVLLAEQNIPEKRKFDFDLYSGEESLQDMFDMTNSELIPPLLGDIYTKTVTKQFSRKSIKLGYFTRYRTKEIVKWYLDMTEVIRFVILAATRYGKTLLIRRIGDWCYHSNMHVIYLTDVNNEMRTSNFPLQEKFHKFLDKDDDTPAATPIVCLRPMFFKQFNESVPDSNIEFQFALNEITMNELLILLDVPEFDLHVMRQAISVHWKKVKDKKIKRLEVLLEEIRLDRNITSNVYRRIAYLFNILIKNKVIGDQNNISFLDILKENAVAVVMSGHKNVGVNAYTQGYVSIFQRIILDARKLKLLPYPVMELIDEAHEFVNDFASISGEEFATNLNTSAKFGIYMGFITQQIGQLPIEVLRQSRYIFVAGIIDVSVYREVLKYAQMYEYTPQSVKDQSDFLRTIHDDNIGRRAWIVVDKVNKRRFKFWSFSSFSKHMESMK